jgi:hypothetical protein
MSEKIPPEDEAALVLGNTRDRKNRKKLVRRRVPHGAVSGKGEL